MGVSEPLYGINRERLEKTRGCPAHEDPKRISLVVESHMIMEVSAEPDKIRRPLGV